MENAINETMVLAWPSNTLIGLSRSGAKIITKLNFHTIKDYVKYVNIIEEKIPANSHYRQNKIHVDKRI